MQKLERDLKVDLDEIVKDDESMYLMLRIQNEMNELKCLSERGKKLLKISWKEISSTSSLYIIRTIEQK